MPDDQFDEAGDRELVVSREGAAKVEELDRAYARVRKTSHDLRRLLTKERKVRWKGSQGIPGKSLSDSWYND